MRGKIHTIAAGVPFLPALARAIVAGELPAGSPPPDPLDLSGVTIYLPTNRAERAMGEAFLAATGRPAMLLPKVRAIAAPDEDALLIGQAAAGEGGLGGAAAMTLPPAIAPMERLLLLSSLVMRWSEAMRGGAQGDATGDLGIGGASSAGASTPAQAIGMARDLAKLMDLVEREGVSLDGLATLVPDDFSEHWQKSLQFLEIITHAWPAVLEEKGLLSPKVREARLIEAEARRLVEAPPDGPVIVAGVTGSIPATIELMRAVCGLPQGAVVLPALDLDLDAESDEAVPRHPEHPEFDLKRLIDRLGVAREDVGTLAGSETDPVLAVRARFISEAMRPTETTARWHDWVATADRDGIAAGLADVDLIESATPQEEAEAVALILREAAEREGETAALVTPDRLLARRVAIRLESWGIVVDDSAGRPFAKTVPGAFLDLVIDAYQQGFAPVATMALLKHPLTRFGMSQREVRFAARALELEVFRRPYIGSGLEAIEQGLARALDAFDEDGILANWRHERFHEDHDRASRLIAEMKVAYRPLVEAGESKARLSMSELARRHAAVAETVSRLMDEEIAAGAESELYKGEAGAAAAQFFAETTAHEDSAPDIDPIDYPDAYRSMIGTLRPVIPAVPKHPRIRIWGPMEAQLQSADTVILGSLNEGTWPDAADPGPWLNRPMRSDLGLPSPEEEIGRKAHQFTSLLGARRAILTRARKSGGVPTVPSRWLMRINALIGGLGVGEVLKPREPWLAWARHRDAVSDRRAGKQPRPRPPVAARPRRLSVSAVERWITNPYQIYAREILKLSALSRLGAEPDAALKGQILHAAMSRFAEMHPRDLPDDVAGELTRLAAGKLDEYAAHPMVAALWGPRFRRFADWFAETEPARREGLEETLAEVVGRLAFAAPGGTFTLTARADRIDRVDGGLVISDYKTGKPPTDAQVKSGRSPQLPLEAAIAFEKGFADITDEAVAALRYIHVSGGEPPGEERRVKCDIAELAQASLANLKDLVAQYDEEATPYAALRRAGYRYDFDDYAHLARVQEWALAEAEAEPEAANGNGNGSNGNAERNGEGRP